VLQKMGNLTISWQGIEMAVIWYNKINATDMQKKAGMINFTAFYANKRNVQVVLACKSAKNKA